MTGREQWLAVAVLAATIVFHAMFPRYEVTVRENAIFRWDRWTGHLDAAGTVAAAPWATALH